MSERDFFQTQARSEVRGAIEAVEAQTSAELVVAVRARSSAYRAVDWAAGTVAAFAMLLALLFHPAPFAVEWMPVEVAIAFAAAAFLASSFWSFKRLVLRESVLRESSWRAACTAFHEKGITRTSGRNGVLVFVSMLERRVEVVTDLGIDVNALGTGWNTSLEALRSAVRNGPDLPKFVLALKSLGPILAAPMPRAADDVNELPDEPDVS